MEKANGKSEWRSGVGRKRREKRIRERRRQQSRERTGGDNEEA
jgi:hypothetical protein